MRAAQAALRDLQWRDSLVCPATAGCPGRAGARVDRSFADSVTPWTQRLAHLNWAFLLSTPAGSCYPVSRARLAACDARAPSEMRRAPVEAGGHAWPAPCTHRLRALLLRECNSGTAEEGAHFSASRLRLTRRQEAVVWPTPRPGPARNEQKTHGSRACARDGCS